MTGRAASSRNAADATGSRAAIDPITEVVVDGVHPGDTGPCGEPMPPHATPDRKPWWWVSATMHIEASTLEEAQEIVSRMYDQEAVRGGSFSLGEIREADK